MNMPKLFMDAFAGEGGPEEMIHYGYEFRWNYTSGGHRLQTETPRYQQIADAVLPLFAEHVGGVLGALSIHYKT